MGRSWFVCNQLNWSAREVLGVLPGRIASVLKFAGPLR